MPKLSIVLPVYNVERYLPTCLESVRGQTMRDLEIVCVDDGSTDRSPILLRMAAELDPRIVVVSQPNGGLSSARNAGLRAATGELVLFVDSDDFLHNKAAATIVAAFQDSGAEIVTFGAYVHPAAGATRWLKRTLSPRSITYEGFDPDLLFKEASRPFVWRSAFTRAFLQREGLAFDESVLFGEDQVFYFGAYPLSRRTTLIPDKLYFYRVARPDSLMASRFEDRTTMLSEHQHLARVILQGWRERGWLDRHRVAALEWVLEFLGGDTVGARGPLAETLRPGLSAILAEYFAPGPWLQAARPTARLLYAQLAGPDSLVGGLTGRAAHLAWRGSTHPLSTAVGMAGSISHSWPALKVKGALWRVLPSSGRAQWKYVRDVTDQVEDDAQRAMALQMLKMEWLAKVAGDRNPELAD